MRLVLVGRLLVPLALLVAWRLLPGGVAGATDRLIHRLEQLGVVIDRLERCAPPNALLTTWA